MMPKSSEIEGLTKAHFAAMRHALGLDRNSTPYRNRFHATVGSDDAGLWTELVAMGLAAIVHVERDMALFMVTDAGRAALSARPRP